MVSQPLRKLVLGAEPRVLQPDLVLCPFLLQFRNPKVSLRVRLCDLLGHLQRSGERDCQEFYRALYIHAQPLHSCLPSRHALRKCVSQSPGLGIFLFSPSPETALWLHLVWPSEYFRQYRCFCPHVSLSLSLSLCPSVSLFLVPVFTQKVASLACSSALPSVI